MRYEVGQKYLFIDVKFTPAQLRMAYIYCPWEDTLESVTIKELTCAEHHRVPGEWDDEVKYDGYIFTDDEANRWNNQYPRAAYGQLDTSNDQRIHRHPVVKGIVGREDMTDFSSYMETLLRGVRDLKKRATEPKDRDTPEWLNKAADSLTKFYKDLDEKLRAEFGRKAVNVGWTANYTDGRPPEHVPEIPDVQIVPVDQELAHIEY